MTRKKNWIELNGIKSDLKQTTTEKVKQTDAERTEKRLSWFAVENDDDIGPIMTIWIYDERFNDMSQLICTPDCYRITTTIWIAVGNEVAIWVRESEYILLLSNFFTVYHLLISVQELIWIRAKRIRWDRAMFHLWFGSNILGHASATSANIFGCLFRWDEMLLPVFRFWRPQSRIRSELWCRNEDLHSVHQYTRTTERAHRTLNWDTLSISPTFSIPTHITCPCENNEQNR